MSKQVYERLLIDFRDEWCNHRNAHLSVEIFAPSSFSTENPPYDVERYDLLAQVALPFDASREITLDGNNSTLFGWAVVNRDEHTTEAVESLRRLCDQGGAALPSQFRERLSGLCHWHMSEPATWWIALLVYLSGESAYAHDGSYQGHAMLLRPFLLSVHAIELCRLNTDKPEFPERNIGSSAGGADENELAAEPSIAADGGGDKDAPRTTLERTVSRLVDLQTQVCAAGAVDAHLPEPARESHPPKPQLAVQARRREAEQAAATNRQVIEAIERQTPKLDTKSVEWIAARQENEKKSGCRLRHCADTEWLQKVDAKCPMKCSELTATGDAGDDKERGNQWCTISFQAFRSVERNR